MFQKCTLLTTSADQIDLFMYSPACPDTVPFIIIDVFVPGKSGYIFVRDPDHIDIILTDPRGENDKRKHPGICRTFGSLVPHKRTQFRSDLLRRSQLIEHPVHEYFLKIAEPVIQKLCGILIGSADRVKYDDAQPHRIANGKSDQRVARSHSVTVFPPSTPSYA